MNPAIELNQGYISKRLLLSDGSVREREKERERESLS
jgi:hypothetical protein